MRRIVGVGRTVEAIVRGCAGADPRRGAQLLRRAPIVDVVDAVRGGQDAADLLLSMASESYRHTNGFMTVTFPAVAGTEARLRLHVWSGAEPAGEALPHVHNHRWPFASVVLTGALRHEAFRARRRGGGAFVRYRHHRIGPNRGYRLSRVGTAALVATEDATILHGTAYHLDPQVLHRVRATRSYTATIVVEYPSVTAVTDVFSATELRATGRPLDHRRLTPDELRSVLDGLAAKLERC